MQAQAQQFNPADSVTVEFFDKEVLLQAKTDENGGKPVYVSKDYIRIHMPRNRDNVMERAATHKDKMQYAPQWEAYKEGRNFEVEGVHLTQWGYATAAQIKTLNHHKIFTVEQLAACGDDVLKTIGGLDGRKIRDAARAYLSNDDEKLNEINCLKAENERLKGKIEELQELAKEHQQALAEKSKKSKGKVNEPANNMPDSSA